MTVSGTRAKSIACLSPLATNLSYQLSYQLQCLLRRVLAGELRLFCLAIEKLLERPPRHLHFRKVSTTALHVGHQPSFSPSASASSSGKVALQWRYKTLDGLVTWSIEF